MEARNLGQGGHQRNSSPKGGSSIGQQSALSRETEGIAEGWLLQRKAKCSDADGGREDECLAEGRLLPKKDLCFTEERLPRGLTSPIEDKGVAEGRRGHP